MLVLHWILAPLTAMPNGVFMLPLHSTVSPGAGGEGNSSKVSSNSGLEYDCILISISSPARNSSRSSAISIIESGSAWWGITMARRKAHPGLMSAGITHWPVNWP